MSALVSGLAFIAASTISLVSGLAFIAQRAGRIRGDPFLKQFNFEFDFFVHFCFTSFRNPS